MKNKTKFAIGFSLFFLVLNSSHIYDIFKKSGLIKKDSVSQNVEECTTDGTNLNCNDETEINNPLQMRDKFADGRLTKEWNEQIENDLLGKDKPRYNTSRIFPLNTKYEKGLYKDTLYMLKRQNYKYTERLMSDHIPLENASELTISYKENDSEYVQLLKNKRTVTYLNHFAINKCPNSNLFKENEFYLKKFYKIYNMSLKLKYHDKIIKSLFKDIEKNCETLLVEKTLDHKILSLFMKDEEIPDFFKNKKDRTVIIPSLADFKEM
jgi:hypothetical protein